MSLLSLVTLIVILAVVGFCVWLVVTYIPMPEPIRKAIIVIVVVVLLLWLVGQLAGGGALSIR
jgi:hypothetical protein